MSQHAPATRRRGSPTPRALPRVDTIFRLIVVTHDCYCERASASASMNQAPRFLVDDTSEGGGDAESPTGTPAHMGGGMHSSVVIWLIKGLTDMRCL
eukprot:2797235-Pyramimonas_sp.AAC.1